MTKKQFIECQENEDALIALDGSFYDTHDLKFIAQNEQSFINTIKRCKLWFNLRENDWLNEYKYINETTLEYLYDKTDRIELKIKELIEVLKEDTSSETVSCNIFINSQGSKLTFSHKKALELQKERASMRNLKGDWIKL